MCVLISPQRFSETSRKNWVRYHHKCILISMWSTRYSCQILMKVDFSADFRKILKCQILWISVRWEPNRCMRADRQDRNDEANILVLQSCEGAWKAVVFLGPICHSVHLCYFKSPLTFAPFRVPTNTFVKKPVAHDITLIFFILIHVPCIFYYSELYKNSDSVRTTSTHRLYIQPPYRLRKNCNNNHFVLNGTILMF